MTFVLLIRGGGPASGYVSTGFFGGKRPVSHLFFLAFEHNFSLGLTLGRVILVDVTKKVNSIKFSIIFNDSKRFL